MEHEIYRVKDFCEHFAISRTSFYREVRAKRLQIIRRGTRSYVARKDAEVWLEKQRQVYGAQELS